MSEAVSEAVSEPVSDAKSDLFAILAEAEALKPLPATRANVADDKDLPHRAEVVELVKDGLDASDYTAACATFASAMSVLETHNDATGVADLNFQWGDTASAHGQLDEAFAKYALAVTQYRALGDHELTAQVRLATGQLYQVREEHFEARKQFAAAELLFSRLGDLEGMAFAHFYTGQTLTAIGEYMEALRQLEICFEEFRDLDDDESAREVAELMAHVCDKTGKDGEAASIRAALQGIVLPTEAHWTKPAPDAAQEAARAAAVQQQGMDFIRDHGRL